MRVAAALSLFCVLARGFQPAAVLSGLGYSAMRPGGCKTLAEVGDELEKVGRHTTRIRIYGTECEQLRMILGVIKQRRLRLRVLVGLWTRGLSLDSETDKLALLLKEDAAFPPLVTGVTVGNEDVFSGIPQAQVIANICQVRERMVTHGFTNISVSTAEVGHLWTKELADASDVVYANLYSFFSRRADTPDMRIAARSIVSQAKGIAVSIAGPKPVVISETGWPSAGDTSLDYFADPSVENQRTFLELLVCHARNHRFDFYALEAFDAPWKLGPSIEAHFGVLDPQGNFKAGTLAPPPSC